MADVDICVFGATGFTGQFVVDYLAKYLHTNNIDLTFAVAGRSHAKLDRLLEKVACAVGTDAIRSVPVIVADVSDADAMRAMCKRSRILLNCVGPYRFYGEQVVSACIESGCHYLDICGEPQFLESMEAKYHETALSEGVVVVGACGFDSVPADIGAAFTVREAEKDGSRCGCIESFLSLAVDDSGGSLSGASGHFTTFECAVHGFGDQEKLRKLRKERKLAKVRPIGTARPPKRGGVFRHPQVQNKFCLPFMGSDASVVRRSQWSRMDKGESPIVYSAFFTVMTRWAVFLFLIFGFVFQLLARYQWGRSLLLKFPRFFTCGLFSHEGPSEEMRAATTFEMRMVALGYEAEDAAMLNYTKEVVTTITGPEPGYVATPIFLVQCALVLREGLEKGEVPRGGVMTTATAFGGCLQALVDRLTSEGITFAVESCDRI
eukprot:TRINITY_DN5877_c1_g2_i1.p1 TRINITY_DN5877_c1_g2~~TRINITY_DN5877_c1_g2_i1.p1  ORF type:complete len:458 (-),score=94.71 TRINITY_DN5877_c1_g2_i1:39-1340(-)